MAPQEIHHHLYPPYPPPPPWDPEYPPHKKHMGMDGFGGFGDGNRGHTNSNTIAPSATLTMGGNPNAQPTTSSPTTPSTPLTVSTTVTWANQTPQPEMAQATQSSAPPSAPTHSQHSGGHALPVAIFGAAGALAAVLGVFVVIGGIVYWCRRKHKRRKLAVEGGGGPQMAMKSVGPNGMGNPSYLRRPATSLGPDSTTTLVSPGTSSSSPSNITVPSVPRMPEPVILPNNGESYFTGIDTSDHLSIIEPSSIHSHDNIYPSGLEEPPPPYRPRSVPPISRESSLRVADGMRRESSIRSMRIADGMRPISMSNCGGPSNLGVRSSCAMQRSPFEDPLEESEMDLEGNPFGDSSDGRDHDILSVVSDLSYQHEPTNPHMTI
jgi:hypothetical protein